MVKIGIMSRRLIAGGAREQKFDPHDALVMVALLATRRMETRQTRAAEAVQFGGKVLCFIFDPVKSRNTAYVEEMRATREGFRGIYKSPALQKVFASSLSAEFLKVPNVAAAIALGVDALFEQGNMTRGA
jgi:hypothetical protein